VGSGRAWKEECRGQRKSRSEASARLLTTVDAYFVRCCSRAGKGQSPHCRPGCAGALDGTSARASVCLALPSFALPSSAWHRRPIPEPAEDVLRPDTFLARQRGKEYYFAERTAFEIGEVVALNRSDGRTKFGKRIRLVRRTNAFGGEALEHLLTFPCLQISGIVQTLNEPEPGIHVGEGFAGFW
jgi:hypothetical protein